MTSTTPHTPPDAEHLLDQFAKMQATITELADRVGMPVVDFCAWLNEPHQRKRIKAVIDSQTMTRKLWLSQVKTTVMAKLVELATTGIENTDPDTVRATDVQRKACVDVLRLPDWLERRRNTSARKPPPRNPFDDAPPAETQDVINRVLEEMAEEHLEEQTSDAKPRHSRACDPADIQPQQSQTQHTSCTSSHSHPP